MGFVTDFITNNIIPLISGLVGAGGAGVILAFLLKRIINHRLDLAMAEKEAQLREKTAGLKNELSIYAHEQNVAASRVDTQRAQAIHTVFKVMRISMDHIRELAIVCDSDGDIAGKALPLNIMVHNCEKAALSLIETLDDNAIYFDKKIIDDIDQLTRSMNESFNDIYEATEGCIEREVDVAQLSQCIVKFKKICSTKVYLEFDQLVSSMRKQLGIEKPEQPKA